MDNKFNYFMSEYCTQKYYYARNILPDSPCIANSISLGIRCSYISNAYQESIILVHNPGDIKNDYRVLHALLGLFMLMIADCF